MKLSFNSSKTAKGAILLLGTFDGVHKGHKELIFRGKNIASSSNSPLILSTFYPHPLSKINTKLVPREITTILERASILSNLGLDEMLVWNFTDELRNLTGDEFITKMIAPLAPKGIVVGFDYTFGKHGAGSVKMLKKLGKKENFFVEQVEPVVQDNQLVSSTAIRLLLAQGDIEGANRLLTRPYSIQGLVVKGKGLGKKLGFPTANVLFPENKVFPHYGVYIGEAQTESGLFKAVINIGRQPTVPSGKIIIEAHILNTSFNLYGKKIRISLLKHLREEIKFQSIPLLCKQLAKDKEKALLYFSSKDYKS